MAVPVSLWLIVVHSTRSVPYHRPCSSCLPGVAFGRRHSDRQQVPGQHGPPPPQCCHIPNTVQSNKHLLESAVTSKEVAIMLRLAGQRGLARTAQSKLGEAWCVDVNLWRRVVASHVRTRKSGHVAGFNSKSLRSHCMVLVRLLVRCIGMLRRGGRATSATIDSASVPTHFLSGSEKCIASIRAFAALILRKRQISGIH